jgi:pyroglutamyl-peptidase
MLKKLLLTGFETFHTHTTNPTEQLARHVHGKIINGYEIVSLVLPVEYDEAPRVLIENIQRHRPSAVISLGLAHKRRFITPELIAVNFQHASIEDNAHVIKNFDVIHQGAPSAYFSTLPLKDILKDLTDNNIPNELSTTAGSYVCNRVFYELMHTLAKQNWNIPAGFIHVPDTLDLHHLEMAICSCIKSLS